MSQVANQASTYLSGFCNMKRLGLFLHPPPLMRYWYITGLLRSIKFSSIHLYTWVVSSTLRVVYCPRMYFAMFPVKENLWQIPGNLTFSSSSLENSFFLTYSWKTPGILMLVLTKQIKMASFTFSI